MNNLKEKLMNTNMNTVMNRLGVANGLIKRAETRITSGQDDDAMGDLEEATNELNACLNEVEDSGYSQGMRQTNTIRAQIQVLQELAETLKEQGKDTSAVDAKIQELQALLDEGMGMMQNGNAGGANKLFEDAEKKNNGMGHSNGGHGKGNGKDD
jgi:type VI protein secretion system component VasK